MTPSCVKCGEPLMPLLRCGYCLCERDARLAALEKVAEAARRLQRWMRDVAHIEPGTELDAALAALDQGDPAP